MPAVIAIYIKPPTPSQPGFRPALASPDIIFTVWPRALPMPIMFIWGIIAVSIRPQTAGHPGLTRPIIYVSGRSADSQLHPRLDQLYILLSPRSAYLKLQKTGRTGPNCLTQLAAAIYAPPP